MLTDFEVSNIKVLFERMKKDNAISDVAYYYASQLIAEVETLRSENLQLKANSNKNY